MKVSRTTPDDAPAMALVHALAFEKPWTEDNFEDLMDGEGIFGLLAQGDAPAGVLICRTAAGEAEVLTVGVAAGARCKGVGRALMTAAMSLARQAGAAEMFLEVDIANLSAIALYERLGFARSGLRKAYYDRGEAGLADALVMRLDLTRAAL